MRGFELLRRIKDQLGAAGESKDRLRKAGYEFLAAAVEREAWPAGFRVEAELVRAGLLVLGVADGDLARASDAAVQQATRELTLLCEKAERIARSHQHGSRRRLSRHPARSPAGAVPIAVSSAGR